MSAFVYDVKYAVRTLLRSPGYTAAALLSLGLGIGANTAIFTLTNAVFLHSLPVREPARVLELFTVDHLTATAAPNLDRTPISYPNFVDLRAQNEVFSGLAAFTQTGLTLTGFGKPSLETAFVVSANYFDVLGVQPVLGRMFRPDEDTKPGGNAVVILSHSLWQRLFGGDRGAIGRTVNLNSISYLVIGVAPSGFKGTLTVGPPDVVWLPLSMHAQAFAGPIEQYFNNRRFRFLSTFGRLKPGIDERQARASLQTVAAWLESSFPKENGGRTVETSPLSEAALVVFPRGQLTAAALALTAAVGFVLLIACANIANLSLARAAKRAREMGIRVALGAPRGRLIRQLFTEAQILALAGGVAGVGIGWLGARLLWTLRPAFLQQNDVDLHLDLPVFAFTLGVSLLTGVLFGIAPVFRASVPDVSRLLNSAGRGNIQGGGHNRLRSLLVVCEMALALVALAGAGLFIRSMQHAQRIDLGFETRDLAVVSFDLGAEQMTPEHGQQFLRGVLEKVRSVPGVASAAIAANAPLGGGFLQTAFREGDPVDSRLGVLTLTAPVSAAYFEAMQIRLLEGRTLNEFDRGETRRVAVLSRAMARRLWPGQPALGKRFHFPTGPDVFEVVGIVRDTTVFSIGEAPQPVAYLPFDQAYQSFVVLHVRTSMSPRHVLQAVSAAVQSLDPDLALLNPGTMEDVIGQALWAPRMAAGLFGVFGLLGMVLAVVGVYGVMAYMVLQRTSEIGIRMAMGARSLDVMRMVAWQSMRLALTGIGLGLAVALALTRLVANLLFDVSPNDPATFLTVAGILAVTALVAGGIPAWRAARIDPVTALRQD